MFIPEKHNTLTLNINPLYKNKKKDSNRSLYDK